MDCEKFDEHVIDALYGELDELTLAALRRHVDGCSRCAPVWNGLNQTRERAILPMDEPSPGLERRILEAERATARTAPWYRKMLRGAAWAGSFAMRPQFAMAAILMLVVGSSLLFLRARPGTMGSPVSVTERGKPLDEGDQASRSLSVEPLKQRTGRGDNYSDGRHAAAAAPADHDAPAAKGAAPGAAATAAAEEVSGVASVAGGTLGAGRPPSNDALQEGKVGAGGNCEAARPELERIARDQAGSPEGTRARDALRACASAAPRASATAPVAPPVASPGR